MTFTRVGPVIGRLGIVPRRFPFFAWAVSGSFDYPREAHRLFCQTRSAAEAFMLRGLVTIEGVEIEDDRACFGDVEVIPQFQVSGFYLDFAVHTTGEVVQRIAVEVDGAEFHQRYETQVEADYARQRLITRAGYSVVRFTAVEAFRDSRQCWLEVLQILQDRGVK